MHVNRRSFGRYTREGFNGITQMLWEPCYFLELITRVCNRDKGRVKKSRNTRTRRNRTIEFGDVDNRCSSYSIELASERFHKQFCMP